jgi:hypothetical protein
LKDSQRFHAILSKISSAGTCAAGDDHFGKAAACKRAVSCQDECSAAPAWSAAEAKIRETTTSFEEAAERHHLGMHEDGAAAATCSPAELTSATSRASVHIDVHRPS